MGEATAVHRIRARYVGSSTRCVSNARQPSPLTRVDSSPLVQPSTPLLTDLYELTMLEGYFAEGMNGVAAFELFVRKLPEHRNFLVAAGLEQAVEYLTTLRFTSQDREWLIQSGRFSRSFVESLETLGFTGDLDALPEGTVFFPDEPILRVVAPLREAQLVETRLLNLVHFQTVVASKAVRCVLAAPGKLLVDFGLRRAHGAEAGLLSARASFLAGFAGTATLEAVRRYGIPGYGTMAHSYIQAHGDEERAFEAFARAHPQSAVLLIDTYDTEAAALEVVDLQRRLAREGVKIRGVRIDSGDLGEHAVRVRAILDAAGMRDTTIFASGNLDELRLHELYAAGAPIDGYGVGTRMNTSADAPYLDCAYKLQEYDGRASRKRSEGKATWPGRKQVRRNFAASGQLAHDIVALHDERTGGTPLLVPILRAGALVAPLPSLEASRALLREQLDALPAPLRMLEAAAPYEVRISPALQALAREVDERHAPTRRA